MAQGPGGQKPQKGTAMKEQPEPSEHFINQVASCKHPLQLGEVCIRKWLNLTSDLHFGEELRFIRQRAFRRFPFVKPCHHDLGRVSGYSLLGSGSYHNLMSEQSVHLSATVARMTTALMYLVPIAINNNAFFAFRKKNDLLDGILCREFWLIKDGSVSPLPLQPLEWDNENRCMLSEGEPLSYYWQDRGYDFPSSSEIVIMATGFFRTNPQFFSKLNLTIIKPAVDES